MTHLAHYAMFTHNMAIIFCAEEIRVNRMKSAMEEAVEELAAEQHSPVVRLHSQHFSTELLCLLYHQHCCAFSTLVGHQKGIWPIKI